MGKSDEGEQKPTQSKAFALLSAVNNTIRKQLVRVAGDC